MASAIIHIIVCGYAVCLQLYHASCQWNTCKQMLLLIATTKAVFATVMCGCAGGCPDPQECNARVEQEASGQHDCSSSSACSTTVGVCVTPKAAGSACTAGYGKQRLSEVQLGHVLCRPCCAHVQAVCPPCRVHDIYTQ